ncbi:MAG TPA: gluconate 2-dehydrogenase subunit 3 family protein [Kineosporiaceae bacterium]
MVFHRPPDGLRAATPGGGQERFPGFDVLDQVGTWDAVTAGVVLGRLGRSPDLRYFTPAEEATGRCLFDRLLDQRDEPRIPVLELVDSRLAESETDGWRYEAMPEDGAAMRRTFAHLDQDAHDRFGRRFCELPEEQQDDLIQAVQDRSGTAWHGLPAEHVWSLWTRYACTAFYSHPWAWNEIGFGGPAYPRGYKALGLDRREPWEVADARNEPPGRAR